MERLSRLMQERMHFGFPEKQEAPGEYLLRISTQSVLSGGHSTNTPGKGPGHEISAPDGLSTSH